MKNKSETDIIDEIHPKIFYLARRKTGSVEAAKDITQDTMLAFFQIVRQNKVKNMKNLPALAYGIMKNKIADYFNAKAKKNKIASELANNIDNTTTDPIDSILDAFEREGITRLLSRLKAIDQQILSLSFRQDLTPEEIAAKMHLSAHYVSVRKNRALKKIKKILRQKRSNSY